MFECSDERFKAWHAFLSLLAAGLIFFLLSLSQHFVNTVR
jgi:hypothetical protein